jgi:hypothetical protein
MQKAKALPDQPYLRGLLDYDPETGELSWAVGKPGRSKGARVGHKNKSGRYWQVMIDRKSYMAHRIIWKLVTGEDPPEQIDHIDQDPYNNRWENLRLATPAQNSANRRGWSELPKGVHPNGSGFKAEIYVEGERLYLGTYQTPDEAHHAYKTACTAINEEFACVQNK